MEVEAPRADTCLWVGDAPLIGIGGGVAGGEHDACCTTAALWSGIVLLYRLVVPTGVSAKNALELPLRH